MSKRAEDREGVEYGAEAPTVEVTVYRHGELIHRELCESEEAAADVMERWSDEVGVECFLDDLAVHHREGQILEPSAGESDRGEAYPRAEEAERS